MSDVFLFFIGCFVSLVVIAAVGLLLWGAANEPRGSLIPVRGKGPRSTKEHEEKRSTDSGDRMAG